MPKLLEETIDVSELNITRAGVPNPQLVPIVDALVFRLDSDKFTVIEVKDKKEADRTAESVRGQLKARGYRVSSKRGTKQIELRSARGRILKDEDGVALTETKFYLYMCAYSPVAEPKEEHKNGTSNGKSKAKSSQTKGDKGTIEN